MYESCIGQRWAEGIWTYNDLHRFRMVPDRFSKCGAFRGDFILSSKLRDSLGQLRDANFKEMTEQRIKEKRGCWHPLGRFLGADIAVHR